MLEPISFAGFIEIPDELTDDEILDLWIPNALQGADGIINFARAILRKASEK